MYHKKNVRFHLTSLSSLPTLLLLSPPRLSDVLVSLSVSIYLFPLLSLSLISV